MQVVWNAHYISTLDKTMNGLQIHAKDNVCIALQVGKIHDVVNGITLLNNIKAGHKIATRDILENEDIIKYGESIGHATCLIHKGEWIHTHNMKTNLSTAREYTYKPINLADVIRQPKYDLYAYRRSNGKVGIRNELWVIVTVGCINSIANSITSAFKQQHSLSDIDGIFTFAHPYGCSQMGDDHANTVTVLSDIVTHPNAGGVLVLGLGCENNQLLPFYNSLQNIDTERIRYLNCQDVEDEILAACDILQEIYDVMRHDCREKVQYSDITFGLKCGGSDGFSGISANPMVGAFSDDMLSFGSNCILSEVPEMFGAEHILMNRAKDKSCFHQIEELITTYKAYFTAHHQVVYENPSPGNKEGGITTLEEKSLGCIQKCGTKTIQGVLQYGEKRKMSGLSLLYGPGNDMVSVTALGASGCQLVLFTTGRGTPFGGFIPTVKIATNTSIYQHKKNWLDFNAGMLFEHHTMDEVNEEFMKKIVSIINGEKTCNEKNGCREIAILKQGVTL